MDIRMVVSTGQEAKGALKTIFKAQKVVYSHVVLFYDVPLLLMHIFTPSNFNTTRVNCFEDADFGLD